MSLRDLRLKQSYRTGRDDLLKDFYVPCIAESSRYRRAVGYFSSHIFTLAAQGISAFFGPQNGRWQLLFGGEVTEEEFHAIESGQRANALEKELESHFIAALERMLSDVAQQRLSLLSFLLATGRLQIKVALRPRGIFHDKIGIFEDQEGNSVVFQGSANESASAFSLHGNWERVTVFRSWEPSNAEMVEEIEADFEALWSGAEKSCRVLDFTKSAATIISQRGGTTQFPTERAIDEELMLSEHSASRKIEAVLPERSTPTLPLKFGGQDYALKEHQKRALEKWKSNSFNGITELCTGAGKTVMAMHAITQIFKAKRRLVVVIAVPYISLAEQWVDELKSFEIYPVCCWSGHAWKDGIEERVMFCNNGSASFLAVLVVNATMASDDFQSAMQSIEGDFLWIGDECHHHRSVRLNAALPDNAVMRLGLSATPFHYWDDEGNHRLREYYGEIVDSYGLADALNDKVLTPYEYHPVLIELTEEESTDYSRLTKEISTWYARLGNDDVAESPVLEDLLRQRTEIVDTARNKEVALEKMLGGMRPTPRVLVYCGVDAIDGADGRQIERVATLFSQRGWKISRFTSKESARTRKATLSNFRDGHVDGLVAIRCLDEGVDVPGCGVAFFLASSRDPRQFIQRRGRVLRRAPGKEKAILFDFIVSPPNTDEHPEQDRRLLQKEFERFREFSEAATNCIDARAVVLDLAKRLDLVHLI